MLGSRWAITQCLLLIGIATGLLGCPFLGPGTDELFLVVSPTELNFGTSIDDAVLEVHKSNSTMPLGAIVVSSTAPWIVVDECTGIDDGCMSEGASDEVVIPIHLDRSRLEAGENSATIKVSANGAVTEVIPVTATALVVADFFTENRAAEPDDEVIFEDRSRTDVGWFITSYLWDFGDGITSTEKNPAPHRYFENGTYDVSLTVTASRSGQHITVTTTRDDYIIITEKIPPTAAFHASATDVFVFTPILFTNESTAGTAPITSYLWDFGDGETSTSENPQHAYEDIGTFTVSLTAFSTDGSDTETRVDYVTIRPVAPEADFEASDTAPAVNSPVQFTDLSDPGSADIETWQWDFGDGETSAAQNPVHVFETEGTFTVMLRVTTPHGTDSETKADYITTHIVAPVADFSADETRLLVDDSATFHDTSDDGSSTITNWQWNFGDGGTSDAPNPSHQYTAAGRYNVSLTVTTDHGVDSVVKDEYIAVFEPTALDRYIRNGDTSYDYTLAQTLPTSGAKVHIINLTSQTWRQGFVDKPVWNHYLVVVEPNILANDTALLFVSGGSSSNSAPTLSDGDTQALAALAVQTQSVTALIEQVPNQPLVFRDETRTRTEDEIIAYTFDKFIETGVEEWPALLPMVKSVVRAMDAIQDFDTQFSKQVEDFVITGASKRGWTTWLTAAADNRVVGIAPMVIDVLNMDEQMEHHFNVYGYYAEDIHDYVDFDIFDTFGTEAGDALLQIVDPFEYRERLDMPKYLIGASGDQFFLPDSAQFYVDQLLGETHLRYIPNTDHGLGGYSNVIAGLMPWYQSILDPAVVAPEVTWTVEAANRIRVHVDEEPLSAKLWFATSVDRDFRIDEELNAHDAPVWSSITLSPVGDGEFLGEVATPTDAWTGFFIELTMTSPYANPYVFTTEIRVTPDEYPVVTPFPPIVDFTVENDNTTPVAGTPVQFLDLTNTGTRPVIMMEWDFGDGETSTDQNPIHTYLEAGTYDVSLTVQTAYGTVTETKDDYITVIIFAPTADFSADPLVVTAGNDVQFTDMSTAGSAAITAWAWDFGDGQTSTDQNPVHAYAVEGDYDVSLTVTSDHGTDTATKSAYVEVNGLTALDTYIQKADATYAYELDSTGAGTYGGVPFEVHNIDLTSQTWRTAGEVDRPVWEHRLSLIVPGNLNSTTAILFINGGSNPGSFGTPDELMVATAVATRSVLALLSQVPNEPLTFTGDVFGPRTEDEIIAYTYAKFLDGGDDEWPLLFPMVKSAVRAMDTVQEYLEGEGTVIDDFIISGASKRGWTTWLTGAADDRVIGIAPIVIDFLNFLPSFDHHYSAYGAYSVEIEDYVNENVIQRFKTPRGLELLRLVDPYEYRDRLTMPKYIMTATGDEFFVIDSAQFYYHDLLGPKQMYSLPGSNHGMDDPHATNAGVGLATWSDAVIRGLDMPEVTWSIDENGLITAHTSETPTTALLLQATSNVRDFRHDLVGTSDWFGTTVASTGTNTYIAQVPEPASGYVAYYLYFEFTSGITGFSHRFSTEVHVLPEALPFTPPSK